MDEFVLYIIDTSSLIDLQRWRPLSIHRQVWEKLDRLIDNDRLVSPQEVYEEIRDGKDALARWAMRHKKKRQLLKKTTRQHVGIAQQVIHRYPEIVDVD